MIKFLMFLLFFLNTMACNVGADSSDTKSDKTLALPGVFSFTSTEFAETLASLPDEISNSILEREQVFLTLMSQVIEYPRETYLLADKQHALSPDYVPGDLVSLNEFPLSVNRRDLSLRRVVMPDVMALTTAALNDGLNLLFSSSYRSYNYQDGLYKRNVRELGQEAADRESARPGTSQHQLGTTIDFGSITDAFAATKEGKWLSEHAWKYGFSLSYPQGLEDLTGYRHECWHYRWIGRPGARISHDFFNEIQHHFLYYLNDHWDFFVSGRL